MVATLKTLCTKSDDCDWIQEVAGERWPSSSFGGEFGGQRAMKEGINRGKSGIIVDGGDGDVAKKLFGIKLFGIFLRECLKNEYVVLFFSVSCRVCGIIIIIFLQ